MPPRKDNFENLYKFNNHMSDESQIQPSLNHSQSKKKLGKYQQRREEATLKKTKSNEQMEELKRKQTEDLKNLEKEKEKINIQQKLEQREKARLEREKALKQKKEQLLEQDRLKNEQRREMVKTKKEQDKKATLQKEQQKEFDRLREKQLKDQEKLMKKQMKDMEMLKTWHLKNQEQYGDKDNSFGKKSEANSEILRQSGISDSENLDRNLLAKEKKNDIDAGELEETANGLVLEGKFFKGESPLSEITKKKAEFDKSRGYGDEGFNNETSDILETPYSNNLALKLDDNDTGRLAEEPDQEVEEELIFDVNDNTGYNGQTEQEDEIFVEMEKTGQDNKEDSKEDAELIFDDSKLKQEEIDVIVEPEDQEPEKQAEAAQNLTNTQNNLHDINDTNFAYEQETDEETTQDKI